MFGGAGTAAWFFWKRKAEQAPVFESIQKAEKLLSLRKELDKSSYTVDDLKQLEDSLMGKAQAARQLGESYELEARRLRELEGQKAVTQLEMNVVAIEAHARAQRKLDEVVARLRKSQSPEDREEFDRIQAKWAQYQEANAKFMASRFEGGSIQPLIYASALESTAIARIVEIDAELQYLKDTIVPAEERDAL